MQAAQEEDRGQRSQSAPPHDSHKHVSKVDIQPQTLNNSQENSAQRSDSPGGPSARSVDEGQNKPHGPTVRHIPIFVEGRDEPLLPREAQDIPIHHETWSSRPQQSPSHWQQPPTNTWQKQTNPHQWQTNAKPPQASMPKPNQSQKPPTPQPAPKLSQEREVKISRDEADAPQCATPPPQKQVKHLETPLEKVAAVQIEVDDLKKKVEQFEGNSKSDKEYIYLDEMLTRNLLKLDNIETEGKEDVRTARKNAIKDIQKYISILESKVGSRDNQNSGMDVDTTESRELCQSNVTADSSDPSLVEQMDVDKQKESEVSKSESSGKDQSTPS